MDHSATPTPAGRPALWPGVLYNILLGLLSLPIVLGLAWRVLVQGKSREGWRERLGLLPPEVARLKEGDEPVIWIHAVSVGEVSAVEPFLRELRMLNPLARIVLSTTTPTGREMAQKKSLQVDALIYFPFDFITYCVHRALATVQPDLVVLVETELWPNFLWMAKRRGCVTAVVNGRISDRAFPRMKLIGPIYAWVLRGIDALFMQSETDAQRVRYFGAPPERIVIAGNSKFDAEYPQVTAAQRAKLRQDLGIAQQAEVVVAGSTAPGEDEMILDAFWRLRTARETARLVLAPRHPERAEAIGQLVRDHGYEPLRRTEVNMALANGRTINASSADRIIILDTIGELATMYAIADVVILGRTLVGALGGSNPLEPLAQGKPIVFGPHMQNFRDIAELVRREQVAFEAADAEELFGQMTRLLGDDQERARVVNRATEVLGAHQGASARCARGVMELLAATREAASPQGASPER